MPGLEHLVIVGGGMAAARLVQELEQRAPGRYRITLVCGEPHAPYDRIQLSSVLAGERTLDQLSLLERGALCRIELMLGRRVKALDTEARRITFQDGWTLPYDRLVLATGSAPIRLPLPGAGLDGVLTFRDLADVGRLMAAGGRAVVIGGGLLGLEAAHGLLRRGVEVTTVHLMPWLMERQLDREGGALLQSHLERLGHRFALAAHSAAIVGDRRVEALQLQDERRLDADLLVMAVGIRPEIRLAADAGIACERGIVVDDRLATSAPGVFAIGECAQHRGLTYGLVAPLYAQAAVLARRLAGEDAAYAGSTVFTSLKISGVELFSAGAFADEVAGERLVLRDPQRGVYRKLIVEDGRLKGAVLVGDASEGAWYAALIERGAEIERFRDRLMFGRAYLEPAELAMAA